MLRPVTYTLAATELDAFQHRKAPMELSEEGKKFYDKALKEKEAITYTGLIAQEVETAAQSLGFDFSGVDKPKNDDGTYGLRYAEFVVPLIKAVQELNNTNEELKIQNEKLLRRMEVLENKNRAANSTLKTGLLQQNNPNPFNEKTVLKYDVPAFANQAVIKIYSSNGAEVISLPVSANGPGQTEISGETLSAGTYTYMLIVDGKAVDSKQMVLTK
jgi:hypothetical protein